MWKRWPDFSKIKVSAATLGNLESRGKNIQTQPYYSFGQLPSGPASVYGFLVCLTASCFQKLG